MEDDGFPDRRFNFLLTFMPKIAEIVNKFDDPETGRAAFEALMAAAGAGQARRPDPA